MFEVSSFRSQNTATPAHSSIKPLSQACMLAAAATFAFGAAGPTAAASSISVNAAQLQLKTDQAAQAAERMKLKADEQTLKADMQAGKMAAESPDAEKVYNDQLAIKGEKKDIAADKSGSLQLKEDKLALVNEQEKLSSDRHVLNVDTRSGRMAAESADAEKVYRDQQFLKGEQKDIAADKAAQ